MTGIYIICKKINISKENFSVLTGITWDLQRENTIRDDWLRQRDMPCQRDDDRWSTGIVGVASVANTRMPPPPRLKFAYPTAIRRRTALMNIQTLWFTVQSRLSKSVLSRIWNMRMVIKFDLQAGRCGILFCALM